MLYTYYYLIINFNIPDEGPSNIRIENPTDNGIRLVWDLPETVSCYGRTDIVVVVFLSNGETRIIRLDDEQSYVDIIGLDPNTHYDVALKVGYDGTELASLPYRFTTGD